MKKLKLDAGSKKAILLGLGFFGIILGVNLAGVPILGRRRSSGGGLFSSGEWKYSKYPLLWDVILGGESKTWNDYNFYNPSLNSRLRTSDTAPFSNKNLTEMTINEVMAYQNKSRYSDTGQLWATGRFQIIPDTLKGTVARTGLKGSDKYNEKNQQKLADSLIDVRSALRNYLNGTVADTSANLKAAALDVARTWSSVGIPYNIGTKKYNQSYYAKDTASVSTEKVQDILKKQRKALGH